MPSILETAILTAQAVGVDLTPEVKCYYDPLMGYSFEELAQFCSAKDLEKFVKSKKREAIAYLSEDVLLKPLLSKGRLLLPIAKTMTGELVCCALKENPEIVREVMNRGDKYKVADEVGLPLAERINEIRAVLEFAKTFVPSNFKLDKCDASTNWELGVDFLTFKEAIYPPPEKLAWGYPSYKLVYSKGLDERVLDSTLLKEASELGLLNQA